MQAKQHIVFKLICVFKMRKIRLINLSRIVNIVDIIKIRGGWLIEQMNCLEMLY